MTSVVTIIEHNEDLQELYRLALRDAFTIARVGADCELAAGTGMVFAGTAVSLIELQGVRDKHPGVFIVAVSLDPVERAEKMDVADVGLLVDETTFGKLRALAPMLAARTLNQYEVGSSCQSDPDPSSSSTA